MGLFDIGVIYKGCYIYFLIYVRPSKGYENRELYPRKFFNWKGFRG